MRVKVSIAEGLHWGDALCSQREGGVSRRWWRWRGWGVGMGMNVGSGQTPVDSKRLFYETATPQGTPWTWRTPLPHFRFTGQTRSVSSAISRLCHLPSDPPALGY